MGNVFICDRPFVFRCFTFQRIGYLGQVVRNEYLLIMTIQFKYLCSIFRTYDVAFRARFFFLIFGGFHYDVLHSLNEHIVSIPHIALHGEILHAASIAEVSQMNGVRHIALIDQHTVIVSFYVVAFYDYVRTVIGGICPIFAAIFLIFIPCVTLMVIAVYAGIALRLRILRHVKGDVRYAVIFRLPCILCAYVVVLPSVFCGNRTLVIEHHTLLGHPVHRVSGGCEVYGVIIVFSTCFRMRADVHVYLRHGTFGVDGTGRSAVFHNLYAGTYACQ